MSAEPGRIAILGAGKIGEALVAGLVSSGWRVPDQIVVTARSQARIDELTARHGVAGTVSNAEAVAGAGIVVDSTPETEDLECHNKAKALLKAVAAARRMTAARAAGATTDPR